MSLPHQLYWKLNVQGDFNSRMHFNSRMNQSLVDQPLQPFYHQTPARIGKVQ